MRHFLILAAVALSFLMSTSMASAFSSSMVRIDGGADTIVAGDTVTMEVSFDTLDEEGVDQNDIGVLSVSVLFDPTMFDYEPMLSLTPSYALYNAGGRSNVFLVPLSTNLSIRGGTDHQVLLDWNSNTSGVTGTRDGCGNYGSYPLPPGGLSGNGCGFVFTHLVFQAIAQGGPAEFVLTSTALGNTLYLSATQQYVDNPTSGNFFVTVPEPASASLSIFALLSLAGLRLRAARR